MKKLYAIAGTILLASMLARGGALAASCTDDSGILRRLEIESILEDVALIHSLDPGLLSAIARVESRECTDAVSPKGAAGLMQLMPGTARDFGVEDRFDPVQNALGAARLIDYLRRERPDGKLTLPELLAAYNAGEGAVTKAHGVPRYRETEAYVRRVLWFYLIGHVPESESVREVSFDRPPQAKPKTLSTHASTPNHRYAPGSDGAILEQLAEVRRARAQAQSSATPTAR